jgi:hypothetical protein
MDGDADVRTTAVFPPWQKRFGRLLSSTEVQAK